MLTEAIVASVIAGSSVCSDHFENVSRFNPTDLSDYQQCVLAAHSSEQAGTLGGVFWARIGTADFVSMPVATLQKAGSAKAAKAIVMEKIVNVLTEEQEAAIDLYERWSGIATPEQAKAFVLAELGLEVSVVSIGQTSITVDGTVYELEDGINQQHVNDVNATWDFIENHPMHGDHIEIRVTDRRGEDDIVYQITQTQVIAGLGIDVEDGHGSTVIINGNNLEIRGLEAGMYQLLNGRELLNGRVLYNSAIHDTTVEESIDGNTLTLTGANTGTYTLLNGRTLYSGTVHSTITPDSLGVYYTVTGNHSGTYVTRATYDTDVANAADTILDSIRDAADLSTIAGIFGDRWSIVRATILTQERLDAHQRYNGNTRGVSYQDGAYLEEADRSNTQVFTAANYVSDGTIVSFTVNGTTYSSTAGPGWTDKLYGAVEDAVEDAYTSGYNAGYDTGYNDGYNDGYADGFTDGVEAVR